jgi:hypothetical protein
MRINVQTVLVLLAAALLLPLLPLGVCQIESRPAEAAAENLFNKGIGNPWVGGEPFSSSTGAADNQMHSVASPANYQIIGFLNVSTGLIVASDVGGSLRFTPGPGNYPVYGYFEANKMTGVFIDLSQPVLGP